MLPVGYPAWSGPVAEGVLEWITVAGAIEREAALRLDRAGADGLVLFNRFLQPDIDAGSLEVVADVTVSNQTDGRLPRTWIALLRGRVHASLAGTSGVETFRDVAAYLLAGADVVMTASALLRHGPHDAAVLLEGLSAWMAGQEFRALREVRGLLAVPADADGADYERALYVKAMRAANAGHYFS